MTFSISRLYGFSLLLLALLVPCSGFSADVRDSLFPSVDKLFEQADAADAPLLSPDNYAEAKQDYAKAENLLDRGKSLDKIRAVLEDSKKELRAAIEASKLAKVTFEIPLKARNDAITANAAKFEPKLWEKAEDQFNSAALKLEAGNVNSAKDRAIEATIGYRDAELAAIKTRILGESRKLINQAEKDKVDKYAPATFAKAEGLIAKASASLDNDRYETGGPQRLAADAEYEARHATYIAGQVQSLGKDFTDEDLILKWEQPVLNVARALDVTTDLSAGFEKSSSASVARATELLKNNEDMTATIAELQSLVGGSEATVKETERLNRELKQVEALFAQNEARILREGNDLIIRLIGLSFPSGQSVIESRYFGLLRNVQDAIKIFPQSRIVIEGHTDSVGSAELNQTLSQERASSVRRYLLANLNLPLDRIAAVGYGKARPIASNDTPEGRARNRRIDVVIKDARAPKK